MNSAAMTVATAGRDFPGLSIRNLYRAVWPRRFVALSPAEAASTFYRFFRSKHVIDLKLIGILTALTATVSLLLFAGFLVKAWIVFESHTQGSDALAGWWKALASDSLKLAGICAIVFAWAYRSACVRLGVVDLFACEIGTLCRVGSLFDVGRQYVEQYGSTGAAASEFVSDEQYFSVFENNSRDLELLEATVVKNITAFYTYMKSLRDALRRLAVKTGLEGKPGMDARSATLASVIYLLFLAYESGRHAIDDLIEYEPSAAENKLVILLTELESYYFLLDHVEASSKHARLVLRAPEYARELWSLFRAVEEHAHDVEWLAADATLGELGRRFGRHIDPELAKQIATLTNSQPVTAAT